MAPTLYTATTTTDVLKSVGVVSFLIDHTGVFFDPDEAWWRLFGRVAAPIFFFLIGFARTRSVPWTWLALGAALTAVNAWRWGGLYLNILFNFALLRVVVLPLVERYAMPRPWALVLLALACVPLIPATDNYLEYGTEGWLWAFFGLAHRLGHSQGDERMLWTRNAIGVVTLIAYIAREIGDYGFDVVQAIVLATLVIALGLSLAVFRREPLRSRPPQPLAALLRFGGRFSLEIYAISLFAMHLLAYAIATQGGSS
jgi:hypothetical protein